MAREPDKSGQGTGQETGKSKSEGTSGARASSGNDAASRSAASKSEFKSESTRAGETELSDKANQTTLPELHAERHRELQASLAKRSESEANPREIVTEFAAVWVPHQVAVMEVLVPALDEEDVDAGKRAAAVVRKDIVNLLLTDLLEAEEDEEDTPAKLEALADALDAFVSAATMELDELTEGADDQTAARLGQRMGARYERAKRRFSNIDQSMGEARELLAPQSLSVSTGRRRSYERESGRERGMARYSSGPERDEYGRFTSEDDRGGRSRGGYGGGQERGEPGRYMSEGRRSRSRYEDEDEGRSYGGGRGSSGRDRDEEGRYASRSSQDRGQGGWFGDPEGHSEASRRGWRSGEHGESGWFGDREGHSEASRRGWRSGEHGESGWFGDREGHSEASRRGWEEGHRSQRRDDEDNGYRSRSRYSDDEDNGRYRSQSRGDDDDNRRGGYSGGGYQSRRGSGSSGRYQDDDEQGSRGRGHGGWSGDPEGHSEAARRGWEHRRG